ncbi:MAG: alpha-L-fucosidase [Bacteroidota bacterium]|nr:alpha-L-fucosidase [Bacteroidota bacterium]
MKNPIFKFLLLIITLPAYSQDIPVPNKAQLAWCEAELGVLFSYDLHVFDGKKYNQALNRITPVADYNILNPEKLDTDQWIKAAKDAGAKFALLTATHETGFALYQSNVNPYCLKAVKWKNGKGDIVRDFVNSCRKYGIQPGIYIGIRWNSFLGVHDFKVVGEGEFRENRQAYYRKMCEGMVEELCTRYGKLFEVWFDGGAIHPDKGAPDVLPIVKKHQPGALFYHNDQLAEARWGGSESGTVPYPCWSTFPNYYSHSGDTEAEHYNLLKHGDPDGKYWMAAMSDAPLRGYNGRHEWFWEPGDEEHIYPLEKLVDMYYRSVGHNSTLILGLTPGPDGLMPEPDVMRLKEFGDEIRKRFSNPVAITSGEGEILPITLEMERNVNTLVLREEIAGGQRVREYRVEAKINDKWKAVAEGSSIGNKRIQEIEPVRAKEFRLIITNSIKEPQIKEFSLYNIRDEFSQPF